MWPVCKRKIYHYIPFCGNEAEQWIGWLSWLPQKQNSSHSHGSPKICVTKETRNHKVQKAEWYTWFLFKCLYFIFFQQNVFSTIRFDCFFRCLINTKNNSRDDVTSIPVLRSSNGGSSLMGMTVTPKVMGKLLLVFSKSDAVRVKLSSVVSVLSCR